MSALQISEGRGPCSAGHATCVLHGRGNIAFGLLFRCGVGFVHSQGRFRRTLRQTGTAMDNSKASHHSTVLVSDVHILSPPTPGWVVGVALQTTAISKGIVCGNMEFRYEHRYETAVQILLP
jgi:hypothetical protein